MKSKTKLSILIITLAIGIGLLMWGNVVMMNYDGYREVWKAARHEALPQFISGMVVLVGCYILTYVKSK